MDYHQLIRKKMKNMDNNNGNKNRNPSETLDSVSLARSRMSSGRAPKCRMQLYNCWCRSSVGSVAELKRKLAHK